MNIIINEQDEYKISTWKSFTGIFFFLFPGFAINELIFGQRIPAIRWIKKDTQLSVNERTFYPCPHCNKLHSSLKWRHANNTAFGNWFGFYCDHCEKIIPCLKNLTSLIILAASSPIWYWFKDDLKAKWLAMQQKKFEKPLYLNEKEESWWAMGLKWGLETFIFFSLIYLVFQLEEFNLKFFIISAIVWILGGLLFGFIMKKYGAKNLEV